ncbi:hypothetical protein BMF94_6285 [Rhodotorula taiwanensis]|uniref:HMG box domain-containing protein n=1 Tax=Rhodotorula taiwanensis TaxID=741276 RepID=A0A2S5B1N4_9BASI|nr:hypothetical protein BMF94_6285 [Rhodotorula taiwanensis]
MPKEGKTRSGKATAAAKPKKDPNAPKRNLSAYMIFSQDKRAEVKEENPDVSFGELGKLLGAKWKSVTPEEKKIYEDKAAADKTRYEKEKAAYQDGESKKKAAKADEDDEDDEE